MLDCNHCVKVLNWIVKERGGILLSVHLLLIVVGGQEPL